MANIKSSPTQATFSHRLANGDKVYRLSLDNTPCMVPDTSLYNYQMPIVKGNVTGFMPNASPPAKIIPEQLPRQ